VKSAPSQRSINNSIYSLKLNRYFVYCRKSSDDDDHQVLSIESQISELKKLNEREKVQIVEQLEESRSAKVPGRPIFDEMLKRIERGEANGIIAWHPDRLARNALDGGRIIHLLDTGKLVDLKFPTYTFENTPQGKYMLGMMFVRSKYYVDSLSENIRRGNRTKREKGWLPNMAPIGYLNSKSNSGEKIIIPDPERFPTLKQLWKLFLVGGYSLAQLLDIATDKMGLRTVQRKRLGGNPLRMSGIYRVFSNPFYTGHIVYKGQWYRGQHESMISVQEFERTQRLLCRTHHARSKRHEFPYTGLMRCGRCACTITAEDKVNRYGSQYVYYRCTRKKRVLNCRERAVQQKELERQILLFLDAIYLDQDMLKQVLAVLEEERQKGLSGSSRVKEGLVRALENCGRNLDNLTRLCFRGLIGDDEFARQRAGLNQEEAKLKQALEQLNMDRWLAPSLNLFLFSNRAQFWLVHGNNAEKRLILAQ
jgi:site-specific DNA recombinase